ncbi:E1Bs [Bat mastadenovirus WIV17]|uniref:E1B protein, small T-antigen n=1 Tax=Bat mastadenovirus WIV17 TaxID=1986505 RepID=A0A1X9RIQ7_9ADEN|nr:E1Bs [Bat mastadenovirus WIV17]ARQ79743.1 E1Bs [Bat mastadenovirus WIV17]
MERAADIPFSFQGLKHILTLTYKASKSSWFWRKFCTPSLILAILEAKESYAEDFDSFLTTDFCLQSFLDTLDWQSLEKSLIPNLDFSSSGRAIASLAFLSSIIDRLEFSTIFTSSYLIENFAFAVWRWAITLTKGSKTSEQLKMSKMKTPELTEKQEEALTELMKSWD